MRIPGFIFAALLINSCSTGAPCSSCPKMEGRYAMTYKDPTVESPDCATVTSPPGPLTIEITRSGAEIRSTFNGTPARGMLQDTSDFSLLGTAEPDGGTDGGSQTTLTLRGFYLPEKRRGEDGGEPAQLVAKWVTHTERGAKLCDAERPATGVKQ